MVKYENTIIIDAKPSEVFGIFLNNAKRDFNKLNINNPVGAKVSKEVSRDFKGKKTSQYETEITNFKKNKVYEVTFRSPKQIFISKYNLEAVGEGQTKLILTEKFINIQSSSSFMDKMTYILYKGQVKKRFASIVNQICDELNLAS